MGSASGAFVFMYTAFFGATWLIPPWLYPNEIFPVQIRAKGAAWGVVGWSIGNGWLMLLSPVMLSAIGEKTMYIFGGVNIACIFLVYLLIPETSCRTLEEIDWLYSSRSLLARNAENAYAEKAAHHTNYTKALDIVGDADSSEMKYEVEYVEHMGKEMENEG